MALRIGEAIDYLYNVVSPWIFVGILVTYFIPDDPSFVPYLLVLGCSALGYIFSLRLLRICWMRGWIRIAFQWLKYYLSKAWIKALLGLRYVRDTWTGRVLGILAVINNVLFVPWVYHNVDLLRWIRSTVQLVRDCIEFMKDPPELLRAFDTWKDSVPVLGYVLQYGKEYVNGVLADCRVGSIWALVKIPVISLTLGLGAVIAYAIWNWRLVLGLGAGAWVRYWNAPMGRGGGGDDDDAPGGGSKGDAPQGDESAEDSISHMHEDAPKTRSPRRR